MSKIYPFRALRPKKEYANEIQCPPYDVISSSEARNLVKGKEKSFLHVVKAEVDLPKNIDLYDDKIYEQAAVNFQAMIEAGYLIQERTACFYIYEQYMGEHHQTGVVAGASIDEYDSGLIKKHELTRADKEKDRTRHVKTLNANTGPVFLVYKSLMELDDFIKNLTKSYSPLYNIEVDGVRHIIYRIDKSIDISALSQLFSRIPALYIADGHHRAASASHTRELKRNESKHFTGDEEYNRFLAVIFPDNQMQILDYNRVVRDLDGHSAEQLLRKISGNFVVAEQKGAFKPGEIHSFGMILNGKWYKLRARAGIISDDPVEALDVSILQNYILFPILGIENPREDKRIDFIGGIRGVEEIERLVDGGEFKLGFTLYPTRIEQLLAVADTGRTMPPKSTWFEPKLRSGLLVHLLD